MDDVTAQGREFLEELDNRIGGPAAQTTRKSLFRAMKAWVLAAEGRLHDLEGNQRSDHYEIHEQLLPRVRELERTAKK